MSQGFLSRLQLGHVGMRRLFNWWPPFRAAGIRVREIAPDFRSATVELRMRLFNRNYVGTHFGGSLFAMCDPFFMIILIDALGPDFAVWDKSATIRFRRPGRGTVAARFEIPRARIEEIRAEVAAAGRAEPRFETAVLAADGSIVAEVEKTISVRLSAPRTQTAPPGETAGAASVSRNPRGTPGSLST